MRAPPATLPAIDDLILRAQKPTRYVGGEFGSVRKDLASARVRFALAFPDVYEVGMSNLGFRLLYHALNDRPEIACERAFLPWPDLEGLLRERRLPLFTLESRADVGAFDVLGISLQFELCYPSALALIDLAGIPVLAAERGDDHPLVVGGGPCAFNPEPVADFFDCFAVGEGEELALEIADVVAESGFRRGGASREELLRRLAKVPGVYVPRFFRPRYDPATRALAAMEPLLPGYEKATRRLVADIDRLPTSAYERPIVPFMSTIHDRLPVEIQRGCTRGCRFCQVGMISRPTRQRSPSQVLRLAESGLARSGWEEVGFLSLSSGDYACLNPLIDDFLARWEDERVALSLPSLRTETMTSSLAERIARVRKTGFTLAPEAATDRLRAVINKGNREEDLLRAIESVFANGWSLLKLYFMIGLPHETDDDVAAIAALARRSLERARRSAAGGKGSVSINLAASTFVPKPHTPFQWDPMITPEETRRRQAIVTAALGGKHGAIHWKPHDSRQSAIEGALAAGDRRVGAAVLEAFRRGQRLDGWTEWFDEQVWLDAFATCEARHGVGLDFFAHRRRPFEEVLPWDRIDVGTTRDFLVRERERATAAAATPDCVLGPCHACGVCDFDGVKNRIQAPEQYVHAPAPARRAPTPVRERVRIRYAKRGALVALSHLETMHAMLRALRRAGLPLAWSQGFHPKPKVSLGPALPVGVESECEMIDVELCGSVDAAEVARRLGPALPPGLPLLDVQALPTGAESIAAATRAVHYLAEFIGDLWTEAALAERVDAFADSARVVVSRESPAGSRAPRGGQKIATARKREIDLKEIVTHLAVEGPGRVAFSLRADPSGSARPSEVLAAVFGDGGAPPEGVKILKEGVSIARTNTAPVTGQPRAPRYTDA
ncbi:MAG TPA: TIGR03960 family B12-binding radical SAM protein [Anaeromyxobacteraceae bacterium]|nr:TIGR03960 family B12-binding radical SAM protein [Anaeromyxobacteraceae bacterium]